MHIKASIMGTIIINDNVSIPESEIDFRFDTSGGPGGQHANRSATRVTLLFDVANSPSLDDDSRTRLLEKLDHHLDKQGVLHVSVRETRSQKHNREIAESRFMALLANALAEDKERVKTKPSPHAAEKHKAKKKKHSQRKQERRTDWSKDIY
jgi:ribosome-associated protein